MTQATTDISRRHCCRQAFFLIACFSLSGCGSWATEVGNRVENAIQHQDKKRDDPREIEVFEDEG